MTEETTSYQLMVARNDKGQGYDPDYYGTPPWVTRALVEFLHGQNIGLGSIWEPACGKQDMVRTLQEYNYSVQMSDIHADEYGLGPEYNYDFAHPANKPPENSCDWVITNPPFGYAKYEVEGRKTPKRIYRPNQFMLNAIHAARAGVAMIVRTNQLGGIDRIRDIYTPFPPTYFLQFANRPNFNKGDVQKNAKSMIDFGWLVWVNREMYQSVANIPAVTQLHWLDGETRGRLERDEDYPAVVEPSGEDE